MKNWAAVAAKRKKNEETLRKNRWARESEREFYSGPQAPSDNGAAERRVNEVNEAFNNFGEGGQS